jgi:hypothetical protein
MRWVLLFAMGCQQGRAPAPTPIPVRAIDARADAPIDAAIWYDDGRAAITIDDELHALAAAEEPPRICFAVSANHRRVACVTDGTYVENDVTTSRTVKIFGELGSATSEWDYLDTDHYSAERVPRDQLAAAVDLKVIEEIRSALADRHYEVFEAASVVLVTTATVGGHDLRRHRDLGQWQYDELIELRCGSRWIEIPLDDSLHVQYGDATEATFSVSAFDERQLLFEVDAHWGIEGGHGHTHGAQLIDTVALCQR